MASGYVSGFQHQLLDEENLTKERFAELCDEWFYHLGRYDMKKLEELDAYRLKEIAGYEEKIQEYTSRLTVLETNNPAELRAQYDEYVETAHKANATYRANHEKETQRLAVVREYAKAFDPHLGYIWKELKDPELFQVDVLSFEEWVTSQTATAKHSIAFYSDLKLKAGARDDTNTEAGRVVDDYERRKLSFLSNQ